jgi:hypothetical protein
MRLLILLSLALIANAQAPVTADGALSIPQ